MAGGEAGPKPSIITIRKPGAHTGSAAPTRPRPP